RTSYVDNEPGKALGQYVSQNVPGNRHVFVISDDSPGAHDEVSGFLNAYQGTPDHLDLAADPMVVPLFSNPGAALGLALDRIRNSGARAVFAHFVGAGAVTFVKAFRSAVHGVDLYAPGFLTEAAQLKQQGDAATGIYTALNYSPDLNNA